MTAAKAYSSKQLQQRRIAAVSNYSSEELQQ
jgi:hypothetical protein